MRGRSGPWVWVQIIVEARTAYARRSSRAVLLRLGKTPTGFAPGARGLTRALTLRDEPHKPCLDVHAARRHKFHWHPRAGRRLGNQHPLSRCSHLSPKSNAPAGWRMLHTRLPLTSPWAVWRDEVLPSLTKNPRGCMATGSARVQHASCWVCVCRASEHPHLLPATVASRLLCIGGLLTVGLCVCGVCVCGVQRRSSP